MIDRKFIGHEFAPHLTFVEVSQLRFFAKATGQTDPVYSDESAAKAAGYRGLLVPPTYFVCLQMNHPKPFEFLDVLGVDIAKLLHGEQRFDYYANAYAGDTLTFQMRIGDIYDKKDGALEFFTSETTVFNQDDEHVADMHSVSVVRH